VKFGKEVSKFILNFDRFALVHCVINTVNNYGIYDSRIESLDNSLRFSLLETYGVFGLVYYSLDGTWFVLFCEDGLGGSCGLYVFERHGKLIKSYKFSSSGPIFFVNNVDPISMSFAFGEPGRFINIRKDGEIVVDKKLIGRVISCAVNTNMTHAGFATKTLGKEKSTLHIMEIDLLRGASNTQEIEISDNDKYTLYFMSERNLCLASNKNIWEVKAGSSQKINKQSANVEPRLIDLLKKAKNDENKSSSNNLNSMRNISLKKAAVSDSSNHSMPLYYDGHWLITGSRKYVSLWEYNE